MTKTRLLGRAGAHGDKGQAALTLVIGITLLLVTAGGMLAVDAQAHDPLVQADAAVHYAYRGLEAGINSYLSTINAQPDLVDCSSASTVSTCTNALNGVKYDAWTQVSGTTQSTGNVPEYYLWTNPQLCFSKVKTTETTCTATPTQSSGNFEYLQVEIIGAAGFPGHYSYQSSVVAFAAGQGFLTRVWWSDYEASDLGVSSPTTTCHYDWQGTSYSGSDGACGPVNFGPGDIVDGPIYTNDSIFVTTKPTFGTPTTASVNSAVGTADPHCLFVGSTSTMSKPPGCKTADTRLVARYTTANSHYGLKQEPIPTKDTTLETLAAFDGCVYSGPTTISFFAKGQTQYMNVFSPETPVRTGHDANNASTNSRQCTGTTPGKVWSTLPAPTAAHTGNGVIYVANSTKGTNGTGTCSGNGDNPFDGKIQHRMTASVPTRATASHPATIEAQVVAANEFPGTTSGYSYPAGETAGANDCYGDTFVRDANTYPSGSTPGIAGNLTVAAQNNVVITGSLEYTDCGAHFSSTYHYEKTCAYHAGAVNDSLGLIATNFVEVSRPGNPNCKLTTTTKRGVLTSKTTCTTSGPSSILAHCASSVSALTAALCNPGPTLLVDAAVLALKQSFTVNDYKVGPATNRLYIYGSVDQKFRGPVGTFSGGAISTGYSKYYVWDSRLQYVSIPHYLTPATPSWQLASSSVVMSASCPGWPKPYPTGSPLSTPTKTPSSQLIPVATTGGPTGVRGAC